MPFYVPVGHGTTFSGVIDVLQEHDDPPECPLPPAEAYQMVVEQIVETDEELMMRYLEGESSAPTSSQGRPRRDRRRASSFRSSASPPARTSA